MESVLHDMGPLNRNCFPLFKSFLFAQILFTKRYGGGGGSIWGGLENPFGM